MQQPPLAVSAIDRDAARRRDDRALDQAWASAEALLLEVHGTELPVRERIAVTGEPTGRLELALVSTFGPRRPEHLYLGLWQGTPVFAVEIAGVGDGAKNPFPESAASGTSTASSRWAPAFEVGVELDAAGRELLVEALALTAWHRTTGFSPRDGEATSIAQGGWVRVDSRGGEHFPRTDPAVIVLVEHGDRLLLGSNALWETGRFSLLAGFIEAGESAEQAVVREVAEESGMRVDRVEYIASQPWPFPRSLMLGFRASVVADADPSALVADPEEISELRWFSREELRNPPPGIRLPMGLSIAGWLIERWIAEGDSGDRAEGDTPGRESRRDG